MNWDWNAIGSIGTAVAVLVAAWQVRRNTQQATSNFEDDLSREYRELARAIPVEVHLGKQLSDDAFREVFPRLFQYIDLSNEQVFLRLTGRISSDDVEAVVRRYQGEPCAAWFRASLEGDQGYD